MALLLVVMLFIAALFIFGVTPLVLLIGGTAIWLCHRFTKRRK